MFPQGGAPVPSVGAAPAAAAARGGECRRRAVRHCGGPLPRPRPRPQLTPLPGLHEPRQATPRLEGEFSAFEKHILS